MTRGGQSLLRMEMSCNEVDSAREPSHDEVDGFEGLVESKKWKKYSKNLKKMAVEDEVFRGCSKNSTVKKE